MNLGAGRKEKDDKIDYNAGIILNKHVGDYVKEGELLCTLYGDKTYLIDVKPYFNIKKLKPRKKDIIISIIR